MDPTTARQFEAAIDHAVATGALDVAEDLAMQYQAAAGLAHGRGDPARAPAFRAAYLAGQVALAAGRLAQAVERLTPLLAVTGRLPEDLAGRLRLLLAEALARLHRHPEARGLLDQIPARLLHHSLLQLRALRTRLWLGEVSHLAAELTACRRALEATGDDANLTLLLCEEGRAWEARGELARARQCWQEAERVSRALDGDSIRADVLLQLARQDHLQGHLASALNRYDLALAAAAPGAQALELQLRRLLVLLDMNQWDQARALAAKVLDGRPPDTLPEEVRPLAGMVQCLLQGDAAPSGELGGYLANARGDMATASKLYRAALAEAATPERQARLALALGLLALAQGHRPEALAWLTQAEALARSLDMPEVLGRALQARGRLAAELDGDEERARPLFEEAVVLAEVQAAQFTHSSDAVAYRRQHGSVLRQLLRAACRRGDPEAMFRYQEIERGRLVLDLWRDAAARSKSATPFDSAALDDVERRLAASEQDLAGRPQPTDDPDQYRGALQRHEQLCLQRDRLLEELLRDRSRRDCAALPALPDLPELRRALPPGVLYLAPSLVDYDLFLLAVSREEPGRIIAAPGPTAKLLDAVANLRGCLASQLARYRAGLPLGGHERAEFDDRLDDLGHGPLGEALFRAVDECRSRPRRLLWVPDGLLHGLPVHALRSHGRYLIEDVEVVGTFSGALLVHQARTRPRRGWFRPALVVTETPAVLPEAACEGSGVAATFARHRTLHGPAATRSALRSHLALARVAHFACHAFFDSAHPLAAQLRLPSGETLSAVEWLDEPVAGLPLVTLSACRSAEVGPLLGGEVFGLLTGLLGAGVRAVLAGLWPVADRATPPLMWSFYRHRLTADLATALALAQREALRDPNTSPLIWAPFVLFGDAAALPPPGWPWRWWAHRRQRRHARRFPPCTIR